MTIKAKLVAMVGVVFALIIIMTGVTYYKSSSALSSFMDSSALDVTVLSAQNVKDKLDSIAAITETAAASFRNVVDVAVFSEDALEEMAAEILSDCKDNGITETYFGWETNGHVSVASGWKEPADYDARTRPWYKSAVSAAKGTVIFTEPYHDPSSNKTVLTAAVAVYGKSGKLLGVAANDIDLTGLGDFIVNSKVMGAGAGTMLQKDGLIIAHPNPDYPLKANILTDSSFDESMKSFARRMFAGETGAADYRHRTKDGSIDETRRVYFAPVGYGYYLSIFCPTEIISSTVNALTGVLIAVAAMGSAHRRRHKLLHVKGTDSKHQGYRQCNLSSCIRRYDRSFCGARAR